MTSNSVYNNDTLSRINARVHSSKATCQSIQSSNIIIAVLTLDAGLLARSQYTESPATGHLDTGFSWFPCVYKRMLRWFPSFQVATHASYAAPISCSSLNIAKPEVSLMGVLSSFFIMACDSPNIS
jgi:hypothetical protein